MWNLCWYYRWTALPTILYQVMHKRWTEFQLLLIAVLKLQSEKRCEETQGSVLVEEHKPGCCYKTNSCLTKIITLKIATSTRKWKAQKDWQKAECMAPAGLVFSPGTEAASVLSLWLPLQDSRRLHWVSAGEQNLLKHIYVWIDFCTRSLFAGGRHGWAAQSRMHPSEGVLWAHSQ